MSNFAVGNNGNLQDLINLYNQRNAAKVDGETSTTGLGLNAKSNDIPDATNRSTSEVNVNAKASLMVFTSGGSQVDTSVLLVQVAVAMRDVESTSQKAKINTDQETKKAQAKEKEGKLEEAQQKMEEAAAKKKEASVLDKIKLAFEWLGAILAVATAAILIVTGVGAAVGVALIAAAVVAIVMAVDSTMAMANKDGQGMFAQAAMADAKGRLGMSDTEAKEYAAKVDMGVKIALAVVGIALAIASGGSSIVNGVRSMASSVSSFVGGAKTAATVAKTAEDVTTLAQTAKNVADTTQKVTRAAKALAEVTGSTVDDVLKVAKTAQTVTKAVDTGTNIASVSVDVSTSAIRYQAAEKTAESKKMAADAKVDEAMMQMLDDMIDQALTRLVASGDRFSAMLDSITDAIQDRGNTLSRAQFKG